MQDSQELEILSVTTTVATRADAQHLAHQIVERRLAACVQVEASLESFYRWKGGLCQEPEVRLVIKTLPECAAALQAFFAQHHPYEVPQFLACRMQASADYARWARGEVTVPPSLPKGPQPP